MKKNNILAWTPIVVSILALGVAVAAFRSVRHRPMPRLAQKNAETRLHDPVTHVPPQQDRQRKPEGNPEGKGRKNTHNAPQP